MKLIKNWALCEPATTKTQKGRDAPHPSARIWRGRENSPHRQRMPHATRCANDHSPPEPERTVRRRCPHKCVPAKACLRGGGEERLGDGANNGSLPLRTRLRLSNELGARAIWVHIESIDGWVD